MAEHVRISAAGFCMRPICSFDEFAGHVRSLLDQAAGSDLVVLPELFTLELFTIEPGWQQHGVDQLVRIDQYTQAYRTLFADEARERGQFIAAGSHLEARRGGYYNVAHLFGPDGQRWEHEKTHLFPSERDWSLLEGSTMEAIVLPFGTVGFTICYEAEIPECASHLVEQGAEIILSPSYTFTEHGFWRVRHCAAARAIENQVYVVHCSTGGSPGGPIPPGWTQSSILAPADLPWTPTGVLAEAPVHEESVVTADLDLAALRQNRIDGAATTFRDRRRRAELYRTWRA